MPRCSKCNKKRDLQAYNILGEDFMLCEDCYEEEANKGFI